MSKKEKIIFGASIAFVLGAIFLIAQLISLTELSSLENFLKVKINRIRPALFNELFINGLVLTENQQLILNQNIKNLHLSDLNFNAEQLEKVDKCREIVFNRAKSVCIVIGSILGGLLLVIAAAVLLPMISKNKASCAKQESKIVLSEYTLDVSFQIDI